MLSLQGQGYDEIPQRPIDRLRPLREDPSKRWKTFQNFPDSAAVSATDLYKDGFFYIGDGVSDRVQCAYCGGILKNWHQGDNIHSEHRRIFSRCPYVNSSCKANEIVSSSEHLFSLQKADKENVSPVKLARYPKYSTKSARLDTYKKWPVQMRQKPDELAEAGLFYTGEADKTLCYHCGGALVEWEPDDVPQSEHDAWFPDCYLTQMRKNKTTLQKT